MSSSRVWSGAGGRLRATLRHIGRTLLGSDELSPMARLMAQDSRWPTFHNAVDYINFEQVPGEILECGVFTGVSLALLAQAQQWHQHNTRRRIVGFDSFEGLPASADEHERWKQGAFATNDYYHPVLAVGGRVTPAVTRELFAVCGLEEPALEVGLFSETLQRVIPLTYPQVALLHVDCDLYESARDVLSGVEPALQDGAMILFDDWFLYKGNPDRGEARAFTEFLRTRPHWRAVHYRSYGTCGNAFILFRR